MTNSELSQATQSHLTILQNIIQRMATNSSSSKAWCITLVSAILVIVADKGKPQFFWIAILPIVLFYLLDVYYLYLEKGFRATYNEFIRKLHAGKVDKEDLFAVVISGDKLKLAVDSLFSLSTLPFYLTLFLMTLYVKALATQ